MKPTPWTVESTNAHGWKGLSIRAADGTYIANVVMQPGHENERAIADLLAAAPELLAACRLAILSLRASGRMAEVGSPHVKAIAACEAAIAKAAP